MVPVAQDGMTTVLAWGDRLVLEFYLLLQMVLAVLLCQWQPYAELLGEQLPRLFPLDQD